MWAISFSQIKYLKSMLQLQKKVLILIHIMAIRKDVWKFSIEIKYLCLFMSMVLFSFVFEPCRSWAKLSKFEQNCVEQKSVEQNSVYQSSDYQLVEQNCSE